jgi:hypothetical protein
MKFNTIFEDGEAREILTPPARFFHINMIIEKIKTSSNVAYQ